MTSPSPNHLPPGNRSSTGLCARALAVVVLFWIGVPTAPASGLDEGEVARVRMAFTHSLFSDVNEADARAALAVYARAISLEIDIPVDPQAYAFEGAREVKAALDRGAVDMVCVPTEDYLAIGDAAFEGSRLGSVTGGSVTEEFLLLVRTGNGVDGFEDFAHRRLVVAADARSQLALVWFEEMLAEKGMPTPERLFDRVTTAMKAARVVLPVFFGQADVCLIGRNGYSVMCELNPQVAQQTRVLARSKPLVTTVSAFRKGFSPALREKVLEAAQAIHRSTSGKQVLTLFRADRLVLLEDSSLDTVRELCALRSRPVSVPGGAVAGEGGKELP